MSAPHYIARAWQCHAATSVGYQIDGHFYQVAECSGFGRSAEEAEQMAAQIAAALNGANGVLVGAFRIYDEDGGRVWIRREGGEGGEGGEFNASKLAAVIQAFYAEHF